MNHIKGVLSKDWYHATVVKTTVEDNKLSLIWKVDQGDYAYRTLIERFPIDDWGLARLARMCDALNFKMFDVDHDEFKDQFYGLRAQLYVDVSLQGDYKVNKIIDYRLPELPADWNVLKEKSSEHFFHTHSPSKLPI